MYMPRLRRLSDVINEMRANDPDSIITRYLLVDMINSGKITAMRYGNAWLINLDELYCVLGGKPDEKNFLGKTKSHI